MGSHKEATVTATQNSRETAHTTSAIERKRREYLAVIAAAQEALARLDSLAAVAEYGEGTVIRWTEDRTEIAGQTLTYVALRIGQFWYLTGIAGRAPVSGNQLLTRLAQPCVTEISVVREWEQVSP